MRQKHKSIAIDTNKIVYLQVENKKCYVVTTAGHFTIPRSLTVLTDELPAVDFCRIHRSVTINMKYVESFDKNNVLLQNGISLPISRYRYSDFLESFSKYMSYCKNCKSSI